MERAGCGVPVGSDGATVVEAIAGLTIALVIMGAAARSLDVARRMLERTERRAAARLAARAAAHIIASEADGLPAADVRLLDSSRVVVQARRALGLLCRRPQGVVLFVRRRAWWALRAPDRDRDSVRIRLAVPAGWFQTGLSSVGAGTCPDGTEAVRLTLGALPDQVAARISSGAAVVLIEAVEYRLYRDATGSWMLGERHRSGGGWTMTSPVVGPLDPQGLRMAVMQVGGRPAGLRVNTRAPGPQGAESASVLVALEEP